MANATLSWRNKHAGVRISAINRAVDKMVGVAKKVKDSNADGEAQAAELRSAARPYGAKLLKAMEAVRSGEGFWENDAQTGNPSFGSGDFVNDYRSKKRDFKSMDKNRDGKLDAAELRGANSRMKQAIIEYVTGR